ncbi:MAG: hypothetical protein ACTTIX_07380, partial [Peptoanaerobacter stomatis]
MDKVICGQNRRICSNTKLYGEYNIPTDIVPDTYDVIDIPNENKLSYSNMKVIDINSNDKQKEITLMLRSTEYF